MQYSEGFRGDVQNTHLRSSLRFNMVLLFAVTCNARIKRCSNSYHNPQTHYLPRTNIRPPSVAFTRKRIAKERVHTGENNSEVSKIWPTTRVCYFYKLSRIAGSGDTIRSSMLAGALSLNVSVT